MDRYEPYYAEDTDGVHFQVLVGGTHVQAYVSRLLLTRCCGTCVAPAACVAVYLENRRSIDAAVERRVMRDGPETVVLKFLELPNMPLL